MTDLIEGAEAAALAPRLKRLWNPRSQDLWTDGGSTVFLRTVAVRGGRAVPISFRRLPVDLGACPNFWIINDEFHLLAPDHVCGGAS